YTVHNAAGAGFDPSTTPCQRPLLSMTDSGFGTMDNLDLRQRGNLHELERALHTHWNLGRNLVLGWCGDGNGVLLLVVPHFVVAEYGGGDPSAATSADLTSAHDFIMHLLSGPKHFNRRQIDNAARLLNTETT